MTNFLKSQSCLVMFKASYQVNIVVDIFACVIQKCGTLLRRHSRVQLWLLCQSLSCYNYEKYSSTNV